MTSKLRVGAVILYILYFMLGYLCGQVSQRRADERALQVIDSLQARPVVQHKDGRVWS